MPRYEYPAEALPGLVREAAESIRQEYKRLGGKPLDSSNEQFAEMIRHYLKLWGMTEQSAPDTDTILGILKASEGQVQ